MNKKKVQGYLDRGGIPKPCKNWTADEIEDLIKDEPRLFDGYQSGCLFFRKSKSGRKYILFVPSRCYIE